MTHLVRLAKHGKIRKFLQVPCPVNSSSASLVLVQEPNLDYFHFY